MRAFTWDASSSSAEAASPLARDHRRLRCVVRSEVLDVLVGERPGKARHDRVLARSGLVIAQRLLQVIGILTAELRIVGRLAVAVEAVARLADFLDLRLSGSKVGGDGRRGGECDDQGKRAKNLHHLLAVVWMPPFA